MLAEIGILVDLLLHHFACFFRYFDAAYKDGGLRFPLA